MLSCANATDSVFQITNQLKLNEPQIELIDDFKQQIETMRLAQGIWYLPFSPDLPKVYADRLLGRRITSDSRFRLTS
jgi:hypothetical protein